MNLNPIVLSIPVFFVLIGVELLVERLSHRKLYSLPDAIANLSCGITSQLSGLFLKIVAVGIYEITFSHLALFHLERTWGYWVALFFLVDLAYYWAHRMSHEINLFWGGHVVHHQSEEYNLSVALRQSSFQVVWTFAFNLPLALAGFHTMDFILISALNTLYQFWIHTETIGKLGFLEHFLNTPSHHRVHHGRNPKYIDKNHAGTLIIWDKLFGTFQAEEEKPTYGITKPLNSWNAVWANFSHYGTMARELQRIPFWTDKLKYLFKKPGWLPDSMGGYQTVPDVDKAYYRKYSTPAPMLLNSYVLFQYTLCLLGTAYFLFQEGSLLIVEKIFFSIVITIVIVNCGVLFENRKWVIWSEWIRIFLYPVGLVFIAITYFWHPLWVGVAVAYAAISLVWFYWIRCNAKFQIL